MQGVVQAAMISHTADESMQTFRREVLRLLDAVNKEETMLPAAQQSYLKEAERLGDIYISTEKYAVYLTPLLCTCTTFVTNVHFSLLMLFFFGFLLSSAFQAVKDIAVLVTARRSPKPITSVTNIYACL